MDNGLDSLEDLSAQVQAREMPVDVATEADMNRLDEIERQKRQSEFVRQNQHLNSEGDE